MSNVCFSNRPFGVKHFQTIRHHSVDVARRLVLLFGIGTQALPSWDTQVGISLKHLELAMPGDAAYLRNIETLLEQSRDLLVPEVMKPKIRHPSAHPQMLECMAQRIFAHRKDLFVRDTTSAQLLQRLNRVARQWDVAAVAILG